MKIIFFVFALTSALVSCKKETSNPNSTKTTTTTTITKTDTTTTSSAAIINSIECASSQLTGILKKGEVANLVSVKINYVGGNGKTYAAQTINSTGVTGLVASLQAGNLTIGNGTLSYSITGTPTTAGTANFSIALGGKSCAITIPVDEVAQTIGKPGPNITDSEGNTYKTVNIGTQTWMAENLKVSKYSDGTAIPNITDNSQWQNNTTGAWSYYNNDVANNAKYGKLYNWYAVSKTSNGNKNICPTGWHVPTDAEWGVLTGYLVGSSAGGKMKEVGTTSWNSPNTDATNASLFSALPGGSRGGGGVYSAIGSFGGWWSSTESSSGFAWTRYLYNNYGTASRSNFSEDIGLSVRCLRD
jgi:uncharacterized protein (TIGR02145 family)